MKKEYMQPEMEIIDLGDTVETAGVIGSSTFNENPLDWDNDSEW